FRLPARASFFARMFRRGQFAAFARSPARFVDLPSAGDTQTVRRDILRDRGPGSDVSAIADAHRRHQCRIAAYKYSFADGRRVLSEAVIIASDRASSNIRLWTDASVAQIGQVRNLRALPNDCLLHFHK